MAASLLFSILDLIWPKFYPTTMPTLRFFAGFQINMLGNSINIKKLNWNPLVLKFFLLKPLKITISWSNLWKKEVPMCHFQNNKHFFSEITKLDHKLSKNPLF